MACHQSVEETMSGLKCHMIKRTDHLNTEDQLASDQEYREWLNPLRIKIMFHKTYSL